MVRGRRGVDLHDRKVLGFLHSRRLAAISVGSVGGGGSVAAFGGRGAAISALHVTSSALGSQLGFPLRLAFTLGLATRLQRAEPGSLFRGVG